MPQIEVTFDIDANGILHVNAKDKATGKENKITIKASSGLSEAEIQKMVKDAEEHAEDDRKMLETVTARNHLDALVHSVQKSVTEHGDKVGADEKGKIEAALKEAGDVVMGINEGRWTAAHIAAELGELPVRLNEGEITVFKSLGLAVEDLFAAHLVLMRAEKS